jgi:hypothetical protein
MRGWTVVLSPPFSPPFSHPPPIEQDVPIDNIIQVLPKTSLSCKDDEITLNEDIYRNLKHRFEKEGTTIEEETFEITESCLQVVLLFQHIYFHSTSPSSHPFHTSVC